MFCEKCGTKIPEGQTQCPNCRANYAPMQQNPFYGRPMNNAGGFRQNMAGGFQPNMAGGMPRKPQKAKSNGKSLLIVGGIVAALLVVILVAVFSGVFASPEGKLAKMEKTTAKVIAEVASQSYGTYLDSLEDSLTKLEKGTGTQADIKLTADKTMLSAMIAAMTGEDMSSVDMSWLDSVLISLDVDAKGKQVALSCGVGVNDKVLATLGAVTDADENKMFLNVPELNAQYLYADLEQMDMELQTAYAMIEPTKQLIEELPSEKEVKKMLEAYLEIVVSYVDEVEKIEETVTVAGETKEMTVLQAKITEPQLMELAIELAKTAQEDETLKTLINAFENYANAVNSVQYGYGYTTQEAYSELQEELADFIEEMEEGLQTYADPENYILLSNYVSSGMIVGRRMETYSGSWSEEAPLYYMYVPTKDGGVFEAAVEDVEIEGVIDGNTVEIDLNEYGTHVLTVSAEELELKDGVLNGQLRLIPGEELMDELSYAYGIGLSTFASEDTYIQLDFDGGKTSGTTGIGLVVGGNTMLELTVKVEEAKYNKITVPTDALSVDSDSDMMTWVYGIEFEELISNMQEAGVPNEYVQLVQQVEMMLQSQGMLP